MDDIKPLELSLNLIYYYFKIWVICEQSERNENLINFRVKKEVLREVIMTNYFLSFKSESWIYKHHGNYYSNLLILQIGKPLPRKALPCVQMYQTVSVKEQKL